MTSFKLDSLSIFLILLFVIVFAMVFKNSWDSMLETKEGFAGMTLTGYANPVEKIHDKLYFDTSNQSLIEETDSGMVEKKRETVTTPEGGGDSLTEIKTFVHKSNGLFVLYVPVGKATFIHVTDGNNNIISQYYNESSKTEKTYPTGSNALSTETGTDITKKDFKDIKYDKDDHMLKTQTVKVDGSKFLIAMKYLSTEVLVGFTESSTASGVFTILPDKNRTIEDDDDTDGDKEDSNNITLKYGDYEINLSQDSAESLASKLGNQFGLFMKKDDYNNDYIHKTQIIPGMGYDHYKYPHYDYDSRRGGRRGYGYYDRDMSQEERDGPRDENGNLLRDFGEGSAALLRDGAKGTADLARDTARGAADLAKDTVTGTRDLAKDTVTGATNIAKDTVTGTRDMATDAVTGTRDVAKDTVSGATNLAKDTASGATNLAKDTASGATNAIGNTLSGTVDFIQSSASGIGNFAKDAASGTVDLGKDVVGGTVGLGKDIVGGVGSGVSNLLQSNSTAIGTRGGGYGGIGRQGGQGGQGGGYQMGGYQNSYGGPQMRQTHGMDPYSYYGAVPPRPSCNYIPRTADFSAFGK